MSYIEYRSFERLKIPFKQFKQLFRKINKLLFTWTLATSYGHIGILLPIRNAVSNDINGCVNNKPLSSTERNNLVRDNNIGN